ncbi:MAG: hypothetical protein E7647_05765 [Ruminococcaceae bacterium]|nr:hypothetical protein [Oscillospiraceae bacterium]
MENVKYPLWEGRQSLHRPGVPMIIAVLLVTVVLSAITAVGFGGILCTGLAGCTFALLLSSVRGFIPWLCLPLSFGAALLMSGDVMLSLCSLFFVPLGVILAYCAFTERGLSVTVAALTVGVLLAMGALLTVSVAELYEGSLKECYSAFGADVKQSLEEIFSAMKLPSADGEIYSLPGEAVTALMETAVMILPAVIVVTCEAIAYVIARAFKLLAGLFGIGALFAKKSYSITVSVPASIIYILSLAVSYFVTEASVIAYSAVNLAYILMPACAVAGFNYILGREGILRKGLAGGGRVMIIIAVVFMIFMSPVSFIGIMAMFGCIYTIYRAIASRKKETKED